MDLRADEGLASRKTLWAAAAFIALAAWATGSPAEAGLECAPFPGGTLCVNTGATTDVIAIPQANTQSGGEDLSASVRVLNLGSFTGTVANPMANSLSGIGNLTANNEVISLGSFNGTIANPMANTLNGIGDLTSNNRVVSVGRFSGTIANPMANTLNGIGDLTATNSVNISGVFTGVIANPMANTLNGIGDLHGGNSIVNSGVYTGVVANSMSNTLNGIGDLNGDISLVNSGRIEGTVTLSAANTLNGIGDLHGNVTLINSGRIEGGSLTLSVSNTPGGIGTLYGVATLTNSGVIVGPINFGGPVVMNNIAGSRVIGAINLGATDDRVNFRGGNYNYTFNSLAAATVDAGGAPFIVTGSSVYVLDPTVFGLEERVLGDLSDAVGDLTESRFDGAAPGMSWVDAAGLSRVVWGSLFASGRNDPGADLGFGGASGLAGGLVGADFAVGEDLTLGVLAGGAFGRIDVAGDSQTVQSTYGFGGVYGRWESGTMFVQGDLLGGFGSHDSERTIANNLAPGGVEIASASYDGWFVSPEIAVGWNRVRPSGLMLTPAFSLRYVGGHFDGYTESGSSDDHVVGSRFAHALEGRAELGLSPEAPVAHGNSQLDWSARVGVVVAGQFGDDIESSLGPALITFDRPGEEVLVGGYVGASVDLLVGETLSLFAGGEGTLWSDGSLSGNLNLGIKAGF
jgi:hypothetical protein